MTTAARLQQTGRAGRRAAGRVHGRGRGSPHRRRARRGATPARSESTRRVKKLCRCGVRSATPVASRCPSSAAARRRPGSWSLRRSGPRRPGAAARSSCRGEAGRRQVAAALRHPGRRPRGRIRLDVDRQRSARHRSAVSRGPQLVDWLADEQGVKAGVLGARAPVRDDRRANRTRRRCGSCSEPSPCSRSNSKMLLFPRRAGSRASFRRSIRAKWSAGFRLAAQCGSVAWLPRSRAASCWTTSTGSIRPAAS